MRFLLFDLVKDGAFAEEHQLAYTSLNQLLQESDFVSIHLSLTSKTRLLIGKPELGKMKTTALLINTSRGGIVDEDALLSALETRQIAGAGLDVLALEPPVPANPLLKLDTVVITPHIGAQSLESVVRTDVLCAENIVSFFHERIQNSVIGGRR